MTSIPTKRLLLFLAILSIGLVGCGSTAIQTVTVHKPASMMMAQPTCGVCKLAQESVSKEAVEYEAKKRSKAYAERNREESHRNTEAVELCNRQSRNQYQAAKEREWRNEHTHQCSPSAMSNC